MTSSNIGFVSILSLVFTGLVILLVGFDAMAYDRGTFIVAIMIIGFLIGWRYDV